MGLRWATVGATVSRLGAVVPLLVLLQSILGDATHDRTTNCTEEAVVGLVARETAGRAAGQSTGETTLTFLCLSGCCLVIATA